MNLTERKQVVTKMRRQGWPLHVIRKRLDYLENRKPYPKPQAPQPAVIPPVLQILAYLSFATAVLVWVMWVIE